MVARSKSSLGTTLVLTAAYIIAAAVLGFIFLPKYPDDGPSSRNSRDLPTNVIPVTGECGAQQ
jgi:hypothetical protein